MRLIDADAFKEYITSACEDMKHLFNDGGAVAKLITESFCKDIDEQPTIQPEPHWIPVTKRLPEQAENNDYYLVTIQCEHVDGWDDYVTGIAEWTTHGWDSLSCYLGEIKVVAWSELPEPYKEVTE